MNNHRPGWIEYLARRSKRFKLRNSLNREVEAENGRNRIDAYRALGFEERPRLSQVC